MIDGAPWYVWLWAVFFWTVAIAVWTYNIHQIRKLNARHRQWEKEHEHTKIPRRDLRLVRLMHEDDEP